MNTIEILEHLYERCNEVEPYESTMYGPKRTVQIDLGYIRDVAKGITVRSDSAVKASWKRVVQKGKLFALFDKIVVTDEERAEFKRWLGI